MTRAIPLQMGPPMQLDLIVEEESAETALRIIVPKILGPGIKFRIINLGSKYKLLKELPRRLSAYHSMSQGGSRIRIAVLIDRDSDDCIKLKEILERHARAAGLGTKTRPLNGRPYIVLNRIVVEELECWFLGDIEGVRKAFPSLPAQKTSKPIYRNPDNGGNWETLHRLLKANGIYRNCFPKVEAAQRIATHFEADRCRSESFQQFHAGLRALVSQ